MTIDYTKEALAISETVIQQLGGHNRLKVMVGANNFSFLNEKEATVVTTTFNFKGSKKMNLCQIIYRRCPDTYIVKFWKKGTKTMPKVISEHEDIYCDQLIELFEKETGLYLHF